MDVTGKTVTSASGSIASLTLPSAASASSSGTSKATITPTSSAQYLNIPTGYLDTAQFYTIAAASGGASNIVTGTFKGTTTGAAMDVTLNYTGSGYPIAFITYPEGGSSGNTSFNSLLQRYATVMFCGSKQNVETAAEYSRSGTSADGYQVVNRYKSSTSTSTTMSQAGNPTYITSGIDATVSNTNILNFKSKTKMSVYIASSSYGFAANYDYRYWVIYSS